MRTAMRTVDGIGRSEIADLSMFSCSVRDAEFG
jgi:hypothetical protein